MSKQVVSTGEFEELDAFLGAESISSIVVCIRDEVKHDMPKQRLLFMLDRLLNRLVLLRNEIGGER